MTNNQIPFRLFRFTTSITNENGLRQIISGVAPATEFAWNRVCLQITATKEQWFFAGDVTVFSFLD